MSTKATIQYHRDEGTQSGYHLFTDVMDSFMNEDMEGQEPVYLELNGVEFYCSSPGNVEVKNPPRLGH